MITLANDEFREISSQTVSGLYIASSDGTPRWIWPAASNRPAFLALYQAITPRQRLFVEVIRLVFFLRLQRLVFSSIDLEPEHYPTGTGWAVFTGTPGPNRKRIMVQPDGTITKKAASAKAARNLQNEAGFLERLQTARHHFSFATPALKGSLESGLSMEVLGHQGTWGHFNGKHAAALGELLRFSPTEGAVGEWREWENIRTKINALRNVKHPAIPFGMVKCLLQLVALEDMQPTIKYGLAHGDFTPWNTLRLTDNRLGIIDWEMARLAMPAGFDFFHFHLQKGVLVERKSWQEIYTDIRTELSPVVREQLFGKAGISVDRYLRLYLIYHISYYLSLYQQQANWHQQIYWQLDVWADALAVVSSEANQRKALISRFFEVLGQDGYAVLKMANDNPLDLPADSDLDVLVDGAHTATTIIDRLRCFPHLASCKVVRKSFMASLLLVLQDGQILNIDLIWKLKRKATVFMDVAATIAGAQRNAYGVPVVSPEDTGRYLRFFYGLNGTAVPDRFGHLKAATRTEVEALPGNQGLNGLINRLHYLVDSVKTMCFNRGFVLTFSGVDGAGKSTVIEHVVRMLDKNFRRPVKVLRHRPSVLPILSAYRYGKAEAERKSVASLPRTGTNTSPVSSLLRFAYYYLDYLLGQWYVYFRYVLRGYAVVYDRYYYDFIVDGRRSNLELPGWITAAGFWLIKKPTFNFFLFAPPDIILARKQELERETIVALTQRYYSLFEGYQRNKPARVFTNIENIVLEDTLGVIRRALLQKHQ